MKKSVSIILTSTAVAGALAVAAAVPAMADDGDDPTIDAGASLETIQQAGAEATDNRISSLEEAISRVESNDAVTDANRTTILGTLTADLASMNDLAGQIAGDTTVADAAEDYRSIFIDYRVYAVALPQAHLAVGADRLTGSALPRLHAIHDKLAERVSAGGSTPELETLLTEMEQSIADAETEAATVAADALAVTPADWNADNSVLTDIRTQLKGATQDARDAAKDARQIAQALR